MIRLNAAFDRIRTAERRATYDRENGLRGAGRSSWAQDFDGTGGAGPPPGRPTGSVLGFGRHVGWSIGEIARVDPGYLLGLEDRREGRPFLDEIDGTLRAVGVRRANEPQPDPGARGGRHR